MRSLVKKLEGRVTTLEKGNSSPASASSAASGKPKSSKPTPAAAAADDDDEEEEIDLFGSSDEEEDAEAEKIKQERLKAYAAKKAKKPGVIAKSSVTLDVKPWDDETDMKEMEKKVRSIVQDGLLWGSSRLEPVGYGINKLRIMAVVEDEKVSIDDLGEKICTEFEDLVQSTDVAAFAKI